MSAEMLREAAALMRERAEAADPGGPRWETGPDEMHGPSRMVVYPADSDSAIAFAGADDAEHIASWHPAVALAVADWLDGVAILLEGREEEEWSDLDGDPISPEDTHAIGSALAVARAYLGTDR